MTSNAKRVLIFGIVCACVVFCCGVGQAADVLDSYALDRLVDIFKTESQRWSTYFMERAKWLFWTLACITLCYKGITRIIGGVKGDFGDVLSDVAQFVISTGFFYYLLCEGPALAEQVIESFQQMGSLASGYQSSERLSPNGIVILGLKIVVMALTNISLLDPGQSLAIVVSALLLLGVFGFIAAKMTVILIGAWVTAYAGIIYLGFGGSSMTKDMAINYIKGCLGMAVKVMVFCLIVGLGQSIIVQMCNKVAAPKTVSVDSYEYTLQTGMPDPRIETDLITRNDLLVLLVMALILLIIIQEVPDLVAGLVSGSHIGSLSSAVTMGAAMHLGAQAVGAASGGVGNVVAGASAMQSALMQTAAQSQAGEGIFRNSSGSGESSISGSFAKAMGTDGLRGAASYAGLAAAGLAKNLVAGATTAMGSEASRTAIGQLDAGVQLNSARDANKRNLANAGGSGPVITMGADAQTPVATGKISGETTTTASPATASPPEAISAVKQGSWDMVNSSTTMMQQLLGNVAGTARQATEQTLDLGNVGNASLASAGTAPVDALPTEPPPLPKDTQ